MSQDQRYLVRPRRIKPQPPGTPPAATDQGALPQSKIPATVAIPVPVPVPMGGDGAEQNRYRVNPNLQMQQGAPAQQGFQFDPQKMPQFSDVQPEPPAQTAPAPQMSPMGDMQTDTDPLEVKQMRAAEEILAREQAVVPKREKRWKSFLKMLAYGARDMPPANDWQELAYTAGRSAGAGTAGIARPDLPGQIQKRYRVREAEENLARTQKTADIASRIADRDSQVRGRAALGQYRTARLGQFQTKLEEDSAFRKWRVKTGNDRLQTWQAWVQWRQANGDRTAKRQEDYFAWQQDVEDDRMKQRRDEFSWRKKAKDLDQVIARERISATENNKGDRLAADRAEADVLEQQADELENDAASEEDEALAKQKSTLASTRRRMAEVKRARLSAVQGSETSATSEDAARPWSSKAWLKAHPGGNVEAAKKKAKAAGAQVID